MKKLNVLKLVCAALVTCASVSVFAGPPQTLSCNQTVYFNGLGDCGGSANLACGPGGILLYYNNMTNCHYYTYINDPYNTSYINSVVTLQPNTVYQAKLTTLDDFNAPGTLLTINTNYYGPGPGPEPVPAPGPAPQPEPPSCSADVADTNTPGTEVVTASCTISMATSVAAYDGAGNLLCQNRQFAALPDTNGTACYFRRDPNHKFAYNVKVYDVDGNRIVDKDGMLYKGATFNYRPQGYFTNSGLELRPTAQVKKNPFSHGYYWDVTVTAVVSDQDVDSSEGRDLIRVQLVDITTNKVLADRTVNSGEQLSIKLEHQEFTSGNGHASNEGLQKGHNVLKLKIYDAYASDNESTVAWPAQELSVDINN